ncbi:hypothetical protein [Sphingomonas sp. ERG5]|uniref:hypothetical protein n=1 Tax=Sphingomonas sp. ERG5 TaxID=1381597 RepID=UPI00054B1EEC|nr:hypothetical protein [Sphingomonas sp. ERG5]
MLTWRASHRLSPVLERRALVRNQWHLAGEALIALITVMAASMIVTLGPVPLGLGSFETWSTPALSLLGVLGDSVRGAPDATRAHSLAALTATLVHDACHRPEKAPPLRAREARLNRLGPIARPAPYRAVGLCVVSERIGRQRSGIIIMASTGSIVFFRESIR